MLLGRMHEFCMRKSDHSVVVTVGQDDHWSDMYSFVVYSIGAGYSIVMPGGTIYCNDKKINKNDQQQFLCYSVLYTTHELSLHQIHIYHYIRILEKV